MSAVPPADEGSIEDHIRARVEFARRRRELRRRQRAAFARARTHGLARRHAAKLRRLNGDGW